MGTENETEDPIEEEEEVNPDIALPDEVTKVLKEKYPEPIELIALPTPRGTMVFRTPTRASWNRFQDKLASDKGSASSTIEELSLSSLVYPVDTNQKPAHGELRAVFRIKPGMAAQISGKLSDLAGAGEKLDSKKL